MRVVRSSPLRTGRLYPQEFSWYSFLEAESTPGHMVISSRGKNPQRHHWDRSRDPSTSSAVPEPLRHPWLVLLLVVVMVIVVAAPRVVLHIFANIWGCHWQIVRELNARVCNNRCVDVRFIVQECTLEVVRWFHKGSFQPWVTIYTKLEYGLCELSMKFLTLLKNLHRLWHMHVLFRPIFVWILFSKWRVPGPSWTWFVSRAHTKA
jgi:hypothetical protein